MFNAHAALAFVNTRKDPPTGLIETLDSPAAASAWLKHELNYTQTPALKKADHARLRALRDSAQRLLRAQLADSPPAADDMLILNQTSAAAPRYDQLGPNWRTSQRFNGSGSTEPRDLTELLAALASATISLAADPSADLAECGAEDCVVLFLRTDPRQRWHSERCGNRVRAARNYAKHR